MLDSVRHISTIIHGEMSRDTCFHWTYKNDADASHRFELFSHDVLVAIVRVTFNNEGQHSREFTVAAFIGYTYGDVYFHEPCQGVYHAKSTVMVQALAGLKFDRKYSPKIAEEIRAQGSADGFIDRNMVLYGRGYQNKPPRNYVASTRTHLYRGYDVNYRWVRKEDVGGCANSRFLGRHQLMMNQIAVLTVYVVIELSVRGHIVRSGDQAFTHLSSVTSHADWIAYLAAGRYAVTLHNHNSYTAIAVTNTVASSAISQVINHIRCVDDSDESVATVIKRVVTDHFVDVMKSAE